MTTKKTSFLIKPHFRMLPSRSSLLRLLLILPVLLIAACQTTPNTVTAEPERQAARTYTLGPGDKIRITVYEHADLSGNFTVDDSGRLSLPLIGGIDVKGMSLPELEKIISQHLLDNDILNPKVSAGLLELRPFCVLGEVRNPGCFSYIHGLTASRAVALAGGYTYRAVKNKFVITREDGRKVKGDNDTPVYRGDLVEVAERFF